MNITFRQLRLFQALAEHGSVTAAARATHVTQATASTQLRCITESVGLPLYEVVGRRVRLTEAGQRLAATARAIAGEWEDFGQSINAMRGLTQGRLRECERGNCRRQQQAPLRRSGPLGQPSPGGLLQP